MVLQQEALRAVLEYMAVVVLLVQYQKSIQVFMQGIFVAMYALLEVYEDGNGNLSINYIEMIPLLVQSINELSAKIEELEGGNNGDLVLMSRERGEATDIDEVDETEVLSLAQNKPNPFSESTTIEVTVPENTGTAAIFIYDMSGKQEKQISISERGKVSVSVTSEGLIPGMYLYSLIADGKVVSTKKMILTK